MQNANGCLERLIPERGVRGNTFEAILNYCQSTVACWVRILIFESYGKSYDGYQCPMLNICPILFYLCPVFEQNLLILTPLYNKNDSIQYLIQN